MGTFIEVKQAPDSSAEAVGLNKYNKSKFPGVFEMLQPARTPDGRWITGLDEDAVSIKSIKDPVLREERREEVREMRLELERLTGFDLSGTSSYWGTYYLKIGEKKALNFDNPIDRIAYYILLSNRYAAPELEAKGNPDYAQAKFYIHRDETEDSSKVLKSRERDKAIADLFALYDNEPKLKLIGKYVLGSKIKDSMKKDTAYKALREAIETDKEGNIVRKFAEATSKTIEELQYKLIIDEAIAKHVIRYREGYYQRGNATYGKSLKDAIKFLSSPEHADEFASIKEEVEEKRMFG